MDSRGFRYALEPVLRRCDWRVSQATRALADATSAWTAERDRHTALEADHAAMAATVDRGDGQAIDVVQRVQALRFLGQVRTRLAESARALQERADAREDAQRALAEAHRAMELLAQHREESRRVHAAGVARRMALTADDDWTARQGWRQAFRDGDADVQGDGA